MEASKCEACGAMRGPEDEAFICTPFDGFEDVQGALLCGNCPRAARCERDQTAGEGPGIYLCYAASWRRLCERVRANRSRKQAGAGMDALESLRFTVPRDYDVICPDAIDGRFTGYRLLRGDEVHLDTSRNEYGFTLWIPGPGAVRGTDRMLPAGKNGTRNLVVPASHLPRHGLH